MENKIEDTKSHEDMTEEKSCDSNTFQESNLRHRIPWSDRISLNEDIPGLREVKELLEEDETSCLAEEEDGVGCPLPSTPEDDRFLDCEVLEKDFTNVQLMAIFFISYCK